MRRIISIWLCIMMVASSAFVMVGGEDGGVVEGKIVVKDGVTYTTHAPIRINSNADFGIGINGVSAGDGSAGNPWIIEGWDINGTGVGYCIYVESTTDYFEVRDCYLYEATFNENTGIYFYQVTNGILINNSVLMCGTYGISLRNSNYNIIANNDISSNRYYGIYILSSVGNTLANNTFTSNDESAIHLRITAYTSLTNNTMVDNGIYLYISSLMDWVSHNIDTTNTVNGKPIYFWKNQTGGTIPLGAGQIILANCSGVIVENQNVSDMSNGIQLAFSSNNIVANNTASSNNYYGINLFNSDNNIIANNTASSNINHGIYLANSDSNDLTDNIVFSNKYNGIRLRYSNYNTVTNNNATSNGLPGICLTIFSISNIITNNTINGDGIELSDYSSYNTVANNTVNGGDIELFKSNSVTVVNNTVNGGDIELAISNSNMVANNIVSGGGILIYSSRHNILTNNTMINSGIYLSGQSMLHWDSHYIDTFNTVNGKSVHYWKNQTSGTVPLGAGQVILANCTNIIIEDQDVSDGSAGVLLGFSSNITITNNIANSNNMNGICLYSSSGNTVSNNIASWNTKGIVISNSYNNTLANNTANSNNPYGIYLGSSSGNIITRNTVSLNLKGITSSTSSGNTIYHNSIISNSQQANDNGINAWDNGYPSGGNYWSDYAGVDLFSGPGQNITGSDGIGDTPYLLSAGQDNYPLMPMNLQLPYIELLSPNNSMVPADSIIDFDVWDRSYDIISVNYSIDGGPVLPFDSPYDIDTTGWIEGATYNIEITALDDDGHSTYKSFNFTVDSILPIITLISPLNNSIFSSGMIIDLDVTDLYLDIVKYSVNNGPNQILNSPHDIDTTGWSDGTKIVKVYAIDIAENTAVAVYNYTLDSTAPSITLNSPANNSGISAGTILDLNVTDPHLNLVNYSLNGGVNISFTQPFDIDTTGWIGGMTYIIEIHAMDSIGNIEIDLFVFTIDIIPPFINVSGAKTPTNAYNSTIIYANITDDFSIEDVTVEYSFGGSSWNSIPMTFISGNSTNATYISTIPASISETTVYYYVNASDACQNWNISIMKNYDTNFPPIIADQTFFPIYPNGTSDVTITANITDKDGIAWSTLYYSTDGGSVWSNVSMAYITSNEYLAIIPAVGATKDIYYFIKASDIFGMVNMTSTYSYFVDATLPTFDSPSINPQYPNAISPVNVSMPIFDNADIANATLWYSVDNKSTWNDVAMTKDPSTSYPFFYDDMEYGSAGGSTQPLNGWTHQKQWGSYDEWEHGIPTYSLGPNESYSGLYCWGTDLDSFHQQQAGYSLISPDLNLSGLNKITFSFYDWLSIWGWGATGTKIVRVWIDDGSNFEELEEMPVGDGETGYDYWKPHSYDISSYAGSPSVNIYFNLYAGGFGWAGPGWYIDDVSIATDNHWNGTIPPAGMGVSEVYYYVSSTDLSGNSNISSIFNYTIDSTIPIITLNSPTNNSVIPVGTIIDLDITDNQLGYVNYTVNSGSNILLNSPYDINTTGWPDGQYIIEVRAVDLADNIAVKIFEFIVDSNPPIVDAGANIFSNAAYVQDATASDAGSGIASYQWILESGPGIITFTPDNVEDPQISADIDGTYVCRLTVTDNEGYISSDNFTLIWDLAAPSVDAGTDAVVNSMYLQDGTVTEALSGITMYSWTQNSGPGGVTFGTPNAEDTTISADIDGTYSIRLTVIDNAGNSAYDEFTLVWDTTAPTVQAGSDECAIATFSSTDGGFRDIVAGISDTGSGIDYLGWSEESGPGIIFFTVTGAVTTDIEATTEGTYVIRLITYDLAGNSAYDEFTLIWDTTLPNVDSGVDAYENAVYTQDATVADSLSGIDSYSWTKQSGPGTIIFGTPDTEDTTIQADIDGTYIIRLNGTDNAGNWLYDEFTLTWDTLAPAVDVGTNRTINGLFLQDATVSDINGMNYQWTKQSGPGIITFGTSNAEDTTISANVDGIYIIRLTVTDNASNIEFDEFELIWDTTSPSVFSGFDVSKNSLYLQDATTSDATSGIVTYLWTQQSGPGTITFGTPDAEDTNISANTDGTYIIRLTITDNASNIGSDKFTLVWDTVNPIVDAGTDAIVNAPYTQNATVTDATSGISTYLWTQQSGPGTITFGTPDAEDTNISADTDGTYIIRLNVTDNAGNWAFDEFEFIWDTTEPTITINTPANNSLIIAGTILDLNVTDLYLNIVSYIVNGNSPDILSAPFDIDTTGWADGVYAIEIVANDTAGNNFTRSYTFTIDSTAPVITLNSPANNSVILPGTILYLSVVEDHLDSVYCSINGGLNQALVLPYNINTTGWADGNYIIEIHAIDILGHLSERSYNFTIDGTAPIVKTTSPWFNTENILINTTIFIQFNEAMDQNSVELAFSLDPNINVSVYHWINDRTLEMTLAEDLSYSTMYTITLGTNITDLVGNPLALPYFSSFYTMLDTDGDGIPDESDADDDNDGVPDIEDDLPLDPTEDTDTDNDGIGDNTDIDDDGDGVPDNEDEFPLDENEWIDTDGDGIGNNVDLDDDDDGVPDELDADPLDPDITDIIDDVSDDVLPDDSPTNYWWLLILMAATVILSLLFFMRKKPETISDLDPELELETELCPTCGFDIELGQPCPFCPDEPAVEPEPVVELEPHPNQEILDKLEQAFKDGKISEENYLKNVEKFG